MKPLLAQSYAGQNPAGWQMSEKLDGVRALWTGSALLSRNGNVFTAPEWFLATLPAVPLDGEIWMARGAFQKTLSAVKKMGSDWSGLKYRVFDAPSVAAGFEDRLEVAARALVGNPVAEIVAHRRCGGARDLDAYFEDLVAEGAEGVMLRAPGSPYESRRSPHLLKLKPEDSDEGVMIGTETGAGQFAGQAGALVLQWGGKLVKVGSGLTHALRSNPPAVGSLITFGFSGFTDSGAPRFPTFQAVRNYE